MQWLLSEMLTYPQGTGPAKWEWTEDLTYARCCPTIWAIEADSMEGLEGSHLTYLKWLPGPTLIAEDWKMRAVELKPLITFTIIQEDDRASLDQGSSCEVDDKNSTLNIFGK